MATASPASSGAIEFDGAQLPYAVRRGDQPPLQATVALAGEAPNCLLIVDVGGEAQAEAIGAALEALALNEGAGELAAHPASPAARLSHADCDHR